MLRAATISLFFILCCLSGQQALAQVDLRPPPSAKDSIGNPDGLAGREIITQPAMLMDPSWEGKVTINIWVNREGDVIASTYDAGRSTTEDPTIIRVAQRGAKRTKFNADPLAPEAQPGTVTFYFEPPKADDQ